MKVRCCWNGLALCWMISMGVYGFKEDKKNNYKNLATKYKNIIKLLNIKLMCGER